MIHPGTSPIKAELASSTALGTTNITATTITTTTNTTTTTTITTTTTTAHLTVVEAVQWQLFCSIS